MSVEGRAPEPRAQQGRERGGPPRIAVVIPAYRVRERILDVLAAIGPEVWRVYVIDDHCPDGSGDLVETQVHDPRVRVLRHERNRGVGGATITGYTAALQDGAGVVVKVDGDGQMDPRQIPDFVRPILDGRADYTKGNRFFSVESLCEMPPLRTAGNAVLSFLNKVASGYWKVMDPTNGYTAVHAAVLAMVPLHKLDPRWFFESDLLFRLNTLGAVVEEVPMEAVYRGERSNLRVSSVVLGFPPRFLSRFCKRVFYNYFLRDFNVCSLEIVAGLSLSGFGAAFGLYHWYRSIVDRVAATTGTVMLAALPVILGFQLLLAAVGHDVGSVPNQPLHRRRAGAPPDGEAGQRPAAEP